MHYCSKLAPLFSRYQVAFEEVDRVHAVLQGDRHASLQTRPESMRSPRFRCVLTAMFNQCFLNFRDCISLIVRSNVIKLHTVMLIPLEATFFLA